MPKTVSLGGQGLRRCVGVRGGKLLEWSQEEAPLGLGLPSPQAPKKSRVCFSWSHCGREERCPRAKPGPEAEVSQAPAPSTSTPPTPACPGYVPLPASSCGVSLSE